MRCALILSAQKRAERKGFSLTELMVVVAVPAAFDVTVCASVALVQSNGLVPTAMEGASVKSGMHGGGAPNEMVRVPASIWASWVAAPPSSKLS